MFILASYFHHEFEEKPGPLVASLLVAVVLYILAGLSRSNSNFVLNALRVIVLATGTVCARIGTHIPSEPINHLLDPSEWPRDIRTALNTFKVDPVTIHYACCKKCFSIYPPTYLKSTDEPQYPTHCTFRETSGSKECNTRLTQSRTKGKGQIPIRRYVYQPMKSWLGRLLSRPGIEASMLRPERVSNSDKLHDIWHGTAFKEFKGPDGKWFFDAPSNEHRLSFSLFIDWFNPYGRKRGGKSASVGAIYMVCMNLPPSVRYRVENVYLVGMIPGPHEPSLHHLNHLIRPLIAELLEFYDPGVFFNRTAQYEYGCLVKGVLIPVICDLPAMRKVTGFMGHTSNYMCSFCKLEKKNIDNFDVDSWPRRTREEHDRHAREWLAAETVEDRANILDKHHVRFSELLNLPYWDIITFALVDTMHNFFEGEIKTHISVIWGMSSEAKDPAKVSPKPHTPAEQAESLRQLSEAIETRSPSKIKKSARLGYLEVTARLNHAIPNVEKIQKQDWANALAQWVCNIFLKELLTILIIIAAHNQPD